MYPVHIVKLLHINKNYQDKSDKISLSPLILKILNHVYGRSYRVLINLYCYDM